ncbi:unnamed protein product, partial [Scytosiphon promiscuus]
GRRRGHEDTRGHTGLGTDARPSIRYGAPMRRPRAGFDAAASELPPRTGRPRRRRRRQIVPTGPPLSGLLIAVLLIASSDGIALRGQAPATGRSVAVSRPPRALGPAGRRRCREHGTRLLPARRATANGGVGDLGGEGAGSGGAAGAAVHTLLIDNYDSYTYNLFQLLAVVNGRAPFVVYNDDDGGDLWKAIERMGRVPDNIVISPGPGRPDVPEDFGMCAQALKEAVDIPILGVCLGHEGLGIEHGATVTHAAEPMHGRLSPIFHDEEDPLFRGVPQGSRVVRYHSLVVDRGTLPADGALRATAWTGDGVLMAMRHRRRPHWGVQFHPESVGTRHGSDVVRNFRDLTVARGMMPSRVERDGTERQRAARDIAIPADVPGIGSSALFSDDLPRAVGVDIAVGDTSAATVSHLTSRGPRPFVLLVEEVDMAGGEGLTGEGEEDALNGGKAVPRAAEHAMPDTEHAFRALYGDDPTAWWLDSSSQRPGLATDGQAKARFTFMGGADGPLSQTIECYGGDRLVVHRTGERDAGDGGGGSANESGECRGVRANIMDYLKAEMAKMGHAGNTGEPPSSDLDNTNRLEIRMVRHGDYDSNPGGADVADRKGTAPDTARQRTLPFDFLGGFVGFLGYELRHEANAVLGRSAGGTEWDWRPPCGGRWEDVTFEGKERTGGPGVIADGVGTDSPAAGPPRDDVGRVGDVPLGFLIFVDRFVAFDHEEGKAYVLALAHGDSSLGDEHDGGCEDAGTDAGDRPRREGVTTAADGPATNDGQKDALDWVKRTASFLRHLSLSAPSPSRGVVEEDATTREAPRAVSTACAMDVPRSRYEQSLEEIMRLVGEGETYEVCLTNQIVCERPKRDGGAAPIPPLDLYSRLRRSNPAPYAAYIVHDPQRRLSPASGGDGATEGAGSGRRGDGPSFAVCCSSPEKFLKVDGDGWVESKPIKGTVKRGKTPAEDLILATELAKGEKNMAENLMIVDLVRNDLGRVCQTGTVSVPKLMHVESYATVHQLVSTIRGQLRPNCGALDAIAAAFPGGSMTGAPKQRTMEIIDRLERGRSRGVYSGSIGFLGIDGAADLNIVIRTAVVTPQNVTVGAGGAVIALSEVDDEYEEMLLKATSVLGALGHVKGEGRRGPPGSEASSSSMRSPKTFPKSMPQTLPEEDKDGLRLGRSASGAPPGRER